MRLLIIMILLLSSLLLGGCGQEKSCEKTAYIMDTVVTLSATGENSEKAVTESMEKLQELEGYASTTGETSDLAKLEKAAGKEYVKLHPEIYNMLLVSQHYSELTDGAWDITTGPLVKLWGIGTDKERVPTAAEIAAAKAKVGWQKLLLNTTEQSAMLTETGMSLDAGGIAKGMALDEVRKIYQKYGIKNGLINLGSSSLYALGKNSKGNAWRVGIKHPRQEEAGRYLGIVSLSEQALSTSGDYERYFWAQGRRYHHIIDANTGYPADNGVVSDTIIVSDGENSGMLSDLLTTAVFVMGKDKGYKFLQSQGENVYGEITTDEGIIEVTGKTGWLTNLDADFSFSNKE